jgi:hypothetical protein
VSFFRGYGKKGVFDSFRKNAAFICSNPEGDGSDGLCYKLMLCTHFSKHRAAFQPAVSVQELVTKLSSSDKSENSTLISVIKHFRDVGTCFNRNCYASKCRCSTTALEKMSLGVKILASRQCYWQQSVDSVIGNSQ